MTPQLKLGDKPQITVFIVTTKRFNFIWSSMVTQSVLFEVRCLGSLKETFWALMVFRMYGVLMLTELLWTFEGLLAVI